MEKRICGITEVFIFPKTVWSNFGKKKFFKDHFWFRSYTQKTLPDKYRERYKLQEVDPRKVIVLAEYCTAKPYFKINELIECILKFYGQKKEDVLKKGDQHFEIRNTRQVIQAILRFASLEGLTENMSLTKIGIITGKFKHCTILNSTQKISGYYQTDKYYRAEINNLLEYLGIKQYIKPQLDGTKRDIAD